MIGGAAGVESRLQERDGLVDGSRVRGQQISLPIHDQRFRIFVVIDHLKARRGRQPPQAGNQFPTRKSNFRPMPMLTERSIT